MTIMSLREKRNITLKTFKNRDSGQGEIGIIAAIVVVLLVIVGATILIGGTWSETNASTMTCVYNGGPMDDNNFIGYEDPSSGRSYQGFASDAINVPVGQRQFRMSLTPGEGDTPVPEGVKARVKGYEMTFEPTVTFTINTEIRDGKPVACDFIERQLRQFGATDFDKLSGSWVTWLNERPKPVLVDVVTRVLQNYNPGELKFNTGGARDEAAAIIGVDLKKALEKQLGDDYFCDSGYTFGGDAAACGDSLTVILPEPSLSAEDEAQLSKPQRAKIDADNEIAAAQEAARKAQEVADAKTTEADAAETLANAEERIANEQARVQDAQAGNDYAWCEYLTSLGQDCALVKAAENSDYPDVVMGEDGTVAVVPQP